MFFNSCSQLYESSKNKTNLKQHYLNLHGNLQECETEFKYYCKVCDYGTFSIDLFNKHNNTNKHNKNILKHTINT